MMGSSRHSFKQGLPILSTVMCYEWMLWEKICINRQIDPYQAEDRWVMLDAVICRCSEKMRRWDAEILPVSKGLWGECSWLLNREKAKEQEKWYGGGKTVAERAEGWETGNRQNMQAGVINGTCERGRKKAVKINRTKQRKEGKESWKEERRHDCDFSDDPHWNISQSNTNQQ